MDDDQNASNEQHNVSENEDVSGIGDGSNDGMELADSESFFEENLLENDEYERDGRIDHSLPPPESSMVEIDMDDLGETQLPIVSCVGQQLANLANSAQDAEGTGAFSRAMLPNLQTLVWVGEFRSSTTLELALLNQNEAHPPMFGILTSLPTEGMSHNE
ncbi:hypothetical protein RchiOBHm_Chr7g0225431 [Rosa chinensis]|uniref:Uncharacterized protein n=1 Tax=Rosa chinensis TaxID=74649 RepID=A0A2P6PE46_ROSCH|nr:hypothetical protein RchiOBHm_Chr7g0225431 [Rosa chinensis]